MSHSRPARPARSVVVRIAVPLAAAALLAGCSDAVTPGSGTGPGVALRVGDESVRVESVDRAADGVCLSVAAGLEQEGQALPLARVRRYVVQTMTSRLQLEQWAQDRGVEAGATYGTRRAELESLAESMPADVRDEFVQVESTQAYAQDLLVQVGRTALQAAGTAEPADEAAFQAGAQDFQAWAAERPGDVELDPRFGLVFSDGSFVVGETGTSVAVSDAAVRGTVEEADPAYTAQLPESQRCG